MSVVANTIVTRIQTECTGKSEEDVRIACERIFLDELQNAGIDYKADYEVQIASGRLDALFNQLIIEYKAPGLIRKSFQAFVEDKKKYLPSLAEKYHVSVDQVVCVLLDGVDIGFFRVADNGEIVQIGPVEISVNSIDYFMMLARSTSKKALIPENVLASFDHNSPVTRKIVSALWTALQSSASKKTIMFFREWNRLFGQVSGDVALESVKRESTGYGIGTGEAGDARKFIFVVHTAYAMIIKHIALMILSSRESEDKPSIHDFAVVSAQSMKELSERIESGERYISLGIRNFLEGDFFSWYIDEWSEDLESAVHDLLHELSSYETKTAQLKPEAVRDLMKRLYEGLVSKEMRHSLGEYYTPDWLAEHVLSVSGYQPGMRILDPTCGSGTFLVTAISRLLSEQPDVKLQDVLSQVYGFDLNPLAVIAARTNYIIAIEPLLGQLSESIDIPVFMGDAIFSPTVNGDDVSYFLDTDEGRLNFSLPADLTKQPGLLSATLSKINSLVSQIWKTKTISLEQAEAVLQTFLQSNHIEQTESAVALLRSISDLESKNWDGIWSNIIKNYLATAQVPSFDIIVGNPPWVRWSALPIDYRNTIKDFCISYNLFSSDRYVGGVESDISTMVLYSAADKWLKNGGRLAMLITRTVFKTESSEGFRLFRIPHSDYHLKVIKVEDYTAVKPFEGAVNKPALLVLEKGDSETTYPIPWTQWVKKGSIRSTDPLASVMEKIDPEDMVACPVGAKGSPWLTVRESELNSCLALTVQGINNEKYIARKGVCTDLNGVYFGKVDPKGTFTNTFGVSGRTKSMRPVTARIERDLLFPVARGREVHPFQWKWEDNYILLPQTGMHGFPIEQMAADYPLAFHYLSQQRELLETRSSLKRYLKNDPFYTCWNVGKYTFSRYKVCWREISSKVQSCVLGDRSAEVVVPDHKIYFVATDNESEAHYLCAFLNATSVSKVVMSYAESTQIGTHIFDYISIPRFDSTNPAHVRLSNISKEAHNYRVPPEKAIEEIDRILLDATYKTPHKEAHY